MSDEIKKPEMVEVPLSLLQKGARVFHPLMPYLRKYLANRNKPITNMSEIIEKVDMTSVPITVIENEKPKRIKKAVK